MTRPSDYLLGIFYAVIVALSIVLNRYVLTSYSFSIFEFIATVSVVMALLSLPMVLFDLVKKRDYPREVFLQISLVGVLASGVATVFQLWGQRLTSATNVGFLLPLAAVCTLPFSILVARERVPKRAYYYTPVILAGLYILVVGFSRFQLALGDALILAAVVVYGLTNALSKVPITVLGSFRAVNLRMVIGGFFLYLLYVLSKQTFVTVKEGLPLVVLSGVLMWLYVFLFFVLIKRTSVNHAVFYFFVYSLFTPIFAVFLLGEQLVLHQIIGGVILLFGTYRVLVNPEQPDR